MVFVSKINQALEVITEHVDLSNAQVSKLVGCSDRTVTRARNILSAEEHSAAPEPQIFITLPDKNIDIDKNNNNIDSIDPVELLQRKLIEKVNRTNPETRALDCLMKLLEKTGKLDYKIKEEEEFKQQLLKTSEQELVLIATGKELPNKLLPKTDTKESLYQ